MIVLFSLFLYAIAWGVCAPAIADGNGTAVPVFMLLNVLATGILGAM